MITIVHWVLLAAAIGVFALSMGVGLNAGLGALGHYVSMVVLAQTGLIILIYAVVGPWGRISLTRFARGIIPAQVVAFSTQSSLASLPAMVEQARTTLGVSTATAGLVLPLAVAVFRITSPVANLLPLLLAVEVIPDIFRTIGNVTGDLAAARIVEGRDAAAEPDPASGI